jgi:hypothetical protein
VYIKRYLDFSGLKCYLKREKPLLTENYQEKRAAFAKRYISYSYFDWKKIIFSDESTFSLLNTNRKEFYWSYKTEPLKEDNIKKSLKFGGGAIMAWGCITGEGVGELAS